MIIDYQYLRLQMSSTQILTYTYKNSQGRRVTVPYHAGVVLHPKLLKSILKDADLTEDQFKEMV